MEHAGAFAHSEMRFLSDDEWAIILFHLLDFQASSTWAGASEGWIFKTDWLGVGYYRDTGDTTSTTILNLGATCRALRARTRPYLAPIARYTLLNASRTWGQPHAFHSLGRFLAETAARAVRSSKGGVTCYRLHEHLAKDDFVSEMVAAYYKRSCTLTTLARGLASAMHFARAIGLAADTSTVSQQGYQLVLTANDDIEHTAKVIVKEAMIAQAEEHARMTTLIL